MAWTAYVMLHQGEGGHVHVMVRTTGDSNLEALTGAAKVTGLLTEGRETVVRAVASATSETDFESKERHHRGFARFTLTGKPEAEEEAA